MMSSREQLERFVARVRRRMGMARLLESAGLGLLLASCAAVALGLAMWWAGHSALGLLPGVLGIGAAVGAAYGAAHWPARLTAASEADRQLGLADLLGTAISLENSAGDERWKNLISALADAQCREISPARVVTARWGAGMWGGMSLAVALALTVAAVSSAPSVTRARAGEGVDTARAQGALVSIQHRPHGAMPGEPGNSLLAREADAATGQPLSGRGFAESRGNGGSTGAGPSIGSTPDSSPEHVALAPTAGRTGEVGETAGGGESGRSGSGDGTTGSLTRGGHILPSPPWEGGNWPAAREAARNDAQSGRVPDRCREVLLHYFDIAVQ